MLVKYSLRRAVVRDLEQSIAKKLEMPWYRACFDIVKAEARRKKHTPLEQGMIQKSGVWRLLGSI
eukprot:1069293-Pyramimonas_sp.AAC.1